MKQHNLVKRLAFKADGYSNALCVISQILAAKLNLADVEMSIIAKNTLKTAHCANLKADTGKPLLFIRHPPTYMGPKAVSAEVAIKYASWQKSTRKSNVNQIAVMPVFSEAHHVNHDRSKVICTDFIALYWATFSAFYALLSSHVMTNKDDDDDDNQKLTPLRRHINRERENNNSQTNTTHESAYDVICTKFLRLRIHTIRQFLLYDTPFPDLI